MKFPFLSTVLVSLCTVLPNASAQVVISEVHYHPIEESLFNTDGSPVLDLTNDVHEFVELQNTGVSSANISGWTLVNGIDFTFPANTSIPAGGFLVIAKNPARLATVYGLNAASILGPFAGTLSNDADTIQLKKADGSTADAIDYSSTFPWAISADALGASDNFTGINPMTYNYKGRSLQRVSASWSGNDPANWLACPLVPGPTPGAAQAVTRSVPKPIVVSVSAEQLSDEAKLIRNNQAVKISCQFSNSYQQVPLTGVSVEYFNEDVNLNTETRNSVAMTSVGNGEYTATLPGRPDRTVVRYRIRANRGDGDEPVSPRADDPQMVLNSSGIREGWHAYFVMPVRALTVNPAPSVTSYDVFVATADIGTAGVRDDTKTLSKNINQTPRRVMPDANGGYPRTETYDSFLTPTGVWWNGHVPAVFVSGDGVVRDARIRYHGSRYRRSESRQSYKIFFPRCNPLNGQTAVFETDKGAPANQSSATLPDYRYEALGEIYRAAGIPCSYTPRVDMYINGNVLLQRMEQSVVDGHFLDNYYAQQAALIPGSKPLKYGEPFKSEGTDEGPYGTGNGAPLAQKTIGTPAVVWTPLQRYQTTYPMDGNEWKGHKDFKTMIDAVAAAKTAGTAALRTYLSENWDVDRTLTYIAIKNWSCPWDDSIHNYYIYRQSDGKWTLLPWDVDFELTTRDPNDITTFSIFKNNNQFKDVFISAFNAEFRQKAFVMNNTLLHPDNLAAMKYAGQSLNSLWGNNWASWIQSRNAAVNTQLALGTFHRPNKPTHVGPANGSTALPPSFLASSAYTHTSNSVVGSNAHANSKWEIRTAEGSWAAPLYVNTSSTNLTSLPIPYEQLTWGRTYFWRVTYLDALDHPSSISDETSFTFGPVPTAETLIPLDAVTQWKYNNVNQFTDQTWTQSGYDDSAWSSGAGVFGHSNNPLALGNLAPPQVLRTDIPLTQPPDNAVGRTAFYFRKKFNFPGSVIGATLKAKIIVDDGVVIHLNGHEIYRLGMNPTAAITYSSTATRAVGAYVYEGPIDLPVTYLLPGENQLAVEVHQQSAGSNDFLMGLQLDTTYLTQGAQIALNEICADNRNLVTNGGKHPDYIELFNNTGAAFSLDGWGLTDDVLIPNKYLFPMGTTIPAQGFLLVWADNDVAAPGLHTGFGLDNGGQTVILTQGSNIRDNVTFGPQAADFPIGRTSSGSGVWALVTASPNAPNVTKSLGSATALKINEWMAEPLSGADWFEIYNPDVNPVALAGLWLSDTPGTPNITQIPPLSFIAPGGFTRFDADGTTRGYNSAKFKLSLAGDSLVLTTAGGSTIDSLTFGLQQSAVAEGRLPDGGATIVSFIKTASPSERNWLPLNNVVIHEVLSASSPPAVDTIELLNASGTAVDISGWWLSDSVANPMKYQLPVAPPMAASSFQVFDENQFNTGAPGSFAIDAVSGETIVLSQVDGSGNLTGYRSQVKLGAAEPGVSFGRIVTAAGESFPPMSALTLGAANALPKIGPVIINEIMYHPVDSPPGTDNALDEFIELQNITGTTVKLYDPANPSNTWKLKDAVDFIFPPNATIPPASYALVVSFDPVANAAQLTAFRNKYSVPNAIPVFGPWSGKLANDTDSVELDRPLAPVLGEVPYVQVDQVNYTDLAPWPPSTISAGPDGFGESIQRKSRTAYGNDPANWEAGAPRAGIDNLSQSILSVTLETDGDGIPDDWEIANGLNPNDANDAASDLDGDGADNLSEYIAGTAANNSSSVFAAAATSVVNGVQISFTAMPNKSYSILYSDQLGAGSWTKLTDVPAQATEHPVQMIDGTSTSRRFYKVVTPQQP